MKRRLVILARLAASGGISLLVLGLTLRLFSGDVADADRPRVLAVMRATWMPAVGAYAALALLQALFRAVRYRILIAAGAPGRPPALSHIYLATVVRNMLVDLLPARLGELSYAGMMNVGCRVPANACLSSLGVSFVFDFIALLAIVAAVVAYQVLTSGLQGWLVTAAAFLLAVGVVLTVLLFFGVSLAARLLERLLGRWRSAKPVEKAVAFLDGVAGAIEGVRRARVLAQVAALSMAVRLTKYAALYVLFKAVAVSSFRSLSHATFPEILTALLCAEGMSSLPVPSFMSFGTYEAGGTLALKLLGFGSAESVAAMLAMHIWSQLVDYSLGGAGGILFLFRRRAAEAAAVPAAGSGLTPRRAAWGLAALAAVLAGLALFGLQWRKAARLGALTPPGQGEAVAAVTDELTLRTGVLAGVRGFAVWSSNRFGNHDILRLDLPGLKVSRLTTHPHVDTFPRISPDGRLVVFARSREPWVSQRNPLPWSIHVLDLASGDERTVSENGNTPTWSEDGATVYFQRDGGDVVAHELGTGAEKVLFAAGRGSIPASVLLQTPSFSRTRAALAVTWRGARRGTLVVPVDGEPRPVGGGCQLAWAPDASYLVYVDDGGRMKNRIYRVDAAGLDRTPWLDLPGRYSHEYFPKVSNDGRWLALGACAAGHEHDTADYEIFLWKIGSAPESAVRLTHHTGNDCWPDVFIER